MKNSIILVLILALLVFVLHALGVFNFGSVFDTEYRHHYENQRAEQVEACPTLRIATAFYQNDAPGAESAKAVKLAVELINARGGITGKKIELVLRENIQNEPQYNQSIQDFCNDLSIAAVLGPYHSADIPTARCLTQYHGLPLVSSVTVMSEKLPPLSPDNYVTFFPPLQSWVNCLLDDMEHKKFNNLLIVSPQTGTYGDIISTALDRAGKIRLHHCQINRINYQEPIHGQKLSYTLRTFVEDGFTDAIFFSGKHADFLAFAAMLQDMELNLPIYITDDAYSPGNMKQAGMSRLYLPSVKVGGVPQEFLDRWMEVYGYEPSYHACLNAVSVYALAEAMENIGTYSPQALLDELHRMLLNRHQTAQDTIYLHPLSEN